MEVPGFLHLITLTSSPSLYKELRTVVKGEKGSRFSEVPDCRSMDYRWIGPKEFGTWAEKLWTGLTISNTFLDEWLYPIRSQPNDQPQLR